MGWFDWWSDDDLSSFIQSESQQMASENPMFSALVHKVQSESKTDLKVESHVTTTEDGYILKIFRLFDEAKLDKKRSPVLLQHGLFSSSETWMGLGDKSVAVMLTQEGYDVWLGNSRGNIYSQGHVRREELEDEYYNFSFYEMGKFDSPAVVDYVLTKTGKTKLSYVGHSQGTTQMFAALVRNHGNLREKLNLFVALAPVTRISNISEGMMRSLADNIGTLQWVLEFLNVDTILGPGTDWVERELCPYFPDRFCFYLYESAYA